MKKATFSEMERVAFLGCWGWSIVGHRADRHEDRELQTKIRSLMPCRRPCRRFDIQPCVFVERHLFQSFMQISIGITNLHEYDAVV